MRVIAGLHKGRRLRPPADLSVRPTSERVREALFSILGSSVEGARMADLYAGTGAVGLEALSRGAEKVVFVDQRRSSLQLLRENLSRCGNPAEALVLSGTVPQILTRQDFLQSGPFDMVFADPPYTTLNAGDLLTVIGERVPVSPEGLIILEHPTNMAVPAAAGGLQQKRQARYGDTTLTFYVPLKA